MEIADISFFYAPILKKSSVSLLDCDPLSTSLFSKMADGDRKQFFYTPFLPCRSHGISIDWVNQIWACQIGLGLTGA